MSDMMMSPQSADEGPRTETSCVFDLCIVQTLLKFHVCHSNESLRHNRRVARCSNLNRAHAALRTNQTLSFAVSARAPRAKKTAKSHQTLPSQRWGLGTRLPHIFHTYTYIRGQATVTTPPPVLKGVDWFSDPNANFGWFHGV